MTFHDRTLATPGERPVMLVLRALGVRDLLASVPALRALRRARPDHELVLAAPAAHASLARLTGAVDRVHPVEGMSTFFGPADPVDITVNLHGKGPQSHRRLRPLAAREFLGFAQPECECAGPAWSEDEHEVRRWCRLVSEGWFVTADPEDLGLATPSEEPVVEDAVVIHPGAAQSDRRWPVERFAEVAAWARASSHRVVVTGSGDEVGLAEEVARAAGLPAPAVLAGRTRLIELAAVVASARLVVSGDTSAAHLASAYRTPSVVLFGPTSPSRWGPPADGPHVTLSHDSLARIGAEEVVDRARELLAGDRSDATCTT